MPSKITLVCAQCKRVLPEAQFLRRTTAAALIRKHQALKAKGLDTSLSEVIEHTPAEREAAAQEAREWRLKNPGRKDADNPHVLCDYRFIGGRKEVGRTCLECRPAAPFEGDIHTTAGREIAINSGALAPTVLASRQIVEQALAKEREGVVKRQGTAALKDRVLSALRDAVSDELRSVRSKRHYLRKHPERATPLLEVALREYRAFVREVDRYLRYDMQILPGLVLQAASRQGVEVVSAEWVLPTLAMACAPLNMDKATVALKAPPARKRLPDNAAALHQRLGAALQACRAYQAQAPFYAAKFPYLGLLEPQDTGIKGIAQLVQQAIAAWGVAAKNEELDDKFKKYDRVLDPVLGTYTKQPVQGFTRRGVPRVRALLELEQDRVFLLQEMLRKSKGAPAGTVLCTPEGYTEFDD